MKIRMIRLAGAAALCLGSLATAHAAQPYPTKPITLIIGFAPGGPTDAIARVLFKQVSQELGQPVIIENRPGAGGNIGSQELLRAQPDGYTLLYGASSITTAAALYGREDLNPKTAFAVAGCSVAVPLILLTAKKTSEKTVQDFYAAIKNDSKKYFLASSGNGSMDHLIAMDIASRLGQTFEHVPYKGNGPALTDVAGGTADFMYSGSFNSATPFINNGQVNALAVTSNKRSDALPDVPTLSERIPGLKGYDAGTWQVLMAPKGTPPDILKKLNDAMQIALKDKAVQKSLRFQGAEPMNKSIEECTRFVDAEYDRWSATIERIGAKAN